ncbi:Tim44-like domain-containing protein [Accumulibacter sp.]|uniref:Tim44 domain-containing protein n=1 Tax=Accumulibacter sp. TaxID=2053492 RepID=UPI002C828739|nr:Tim44-like domain-containing protein [Accumulibacter sp.]HPU80021.1 Tim44-like domain-containing protein [Accumulibacter sp.]
MKRILMVLSVCVLSLGLAVGDADAKRLGGGKSTGMQRESVTQRSATPPQSAAAAPAVASAAAPAATAPKRNWMGPLAGLAAGLGIAALMSHFGMGEGLGNFLMIALLLLGAVVVFKLIFRRKVPSIPGSESLQYAGAGPGVPLDSRPGFPADDHYAGQGAGVPGSLATQAPANIPAGFDVDAFLRVAKLNFVRLQAANDAGNLEDMREFVAPELFAEIKLQLDERGKAIQQTDVVTLNAELLEVVTEPTRHIASVRFSGMIREEAGAPAAPFDEVWNLAKAVEGGKGWVVAGIQQLS